MIPFALIMICLSLASVATDKKEVKTTKQYRPFGVCENHTLEKGSNKYESSVVYCSKKDLNEELK